MLHRFFGSDDMAFSPRGKKFFIAQLETVGAQADALVAGKLLTEEECEAVHTAISSALSRVENDTSADAEDVLRNSLGETFEKLFAGSSQCDRDATVLRLYTRSSADEALAALRELVETLCHRAKDGLHYLMPGYTHLQHAHPVSCGLYFNAYSEMFLRDMERFSDCRRRMNVLPLGSVSMAGTSLPIDRERARVALRFDDISSNASDAVSDCDFIAEYLFCASLTLAHLSRLCEDAVLYSSSEFGLWTLSDDHVERSYELPQKRDPVTAERVRGGTGRVYGSLVALLTAIKGLPLSYNGDINEARQTLFDAERILFPCIAVVSDLIKKMTLNVSEMFDAAGEGNATAADVAEYLVLRGMTVREAYGVTRELLDICERKGKSLLGLPFDDFRSVSPLFEKDVLATVTARSSSESRKSAGASSIEAARHGLGNVKRRLRNF